MQKIIKGDSVQVIAGRDKGKTGSVTAVTEHGKMLIVEGINIVKKHVKANPNINEQGGIKEKNQPIDASNVMLIDPTTNKPARVGIRVLEDGKRVRYFKKSNQLVEAK
jgi:large subunit ribosomal protein L24